MTIFKLFILQIVKDDEYMAPVLIPIKNLQIINIQNHGTNALAGLAITCNTILIINEFFRPYLSAIVPNIPEPTITPNE